jgi:hypothetical protein
MGLILDARGSLFVSRVHSLWKAETSAQDQDVKLSRLLSSEDIVQIQGVQSQKLCRRSWTRQTRSMMNTNIESSTDVCPCTKRCHC